MAGSAAFTRSGESGFLELGFCPGALATNVGTGNQSLISINGGWTAHPKFSLEGPCL